MILKKGYNKIALNAIPADKIADGSFPNRQFKNGVVVR